MVKGFGSKSYRRGLSGFEPSESDKQSSFQKVMISSESCYINYIS